MSRLTQLRDAFVNTIGTIKQGIGNWLASFTRRKVFTYLLIFLFALGVLSGYAFSLPTLFASSALVPVALEMVSNIIRFVVRRITNRVAHRVNETVTHFSQAPSGIGSEEEPTLPRASQSIDPDRIVNALAVGDQQRALQLLENVNVNRTQGLLNIASEAIRRDAGAVFTRLLRIPQLQVHAADNNNRLLVQAVREQRVNMVTSLLTIERVRNNAEISNNEALREACSIGSLPIVTALLGCPNVVANITFNHNEAVRLAETNGHYEVVARLLEIPAVASYQTPRATHLTFTPRAQTIPPRPMAAEPGDFFNLFFGGIAGLNRPRAGVAAPELRDFANRRENAMAELNENQVRDLGEIQSRYQDTVNTRGIDSILAEIRGFLIEAYEKDPVKHNGRNLPINYDRSLPNSVQALYYQHKIHTAYRYLFLHPNPWISPRPSHATHHPNGGHSATIEHNHKLRIAFLWLAASDRNRPLPEGYTQEQLKQVFAELILAGAGRGHNWDKTRIKTKQVKNKTTGVLETVNETEEYDDGLPDNPTCGWGVSQWVTQFLTIIANDRPESRPLSTDIIKNKFKAILVAEGSNKDTIFNKLAALKKADLEATQEALKNLIVVNLNDKDALEAAEKRLVEHLEFSKSTVDTMVNECKTFFGAERITAKTAVTYQGKKFNNYEECLRHLANNVLQDFYNEIDAKIESLKKGPEAKKGKTPSASKEETLGKVVRFSTKALGKTVSPKKKDSKDDKEEESSSSSPKPARRRR